MNPQLVQAVESLAESLKTRVWPQTVVDWAQLALVFLTLATLAVLIWYTVETKRLRVATQRQVAASEMQVELTHKLLLADQEQREWAITPFIICRARQADGRFVIEMQNGGGGPAVNIHFNQLGQIGRIAYQFANSDALQPGEVDGMYITQVGVSWATELEIFVSEAMQAGIKTIPITATFESIHGTRFRSTHTFDLTTPTDVMLRFSAFDRAGAEREG